MPLRPKDKSEGFTLIEFLVALLVFAIGILALTSLQIFVLRSDISAHHQAQAVQIAYSMMDRLRSNRICCNSWLLQYTKCSRYLCWRWQPSFSG